MGKLARKLLILTAFVLLFCVKNNSITASAGVNYHTSGKAGDNITWTFDEDTNTLIFSGTGRMYDYYGEESEFKKYHKHHTYKIIFGEGITYIGANSCSDFNSLGTVQFPLKSLVEIGTGALDGELWIDNLYFPDSLEKLSSSAFGGRMGYIREFKLPSAIKELSSGALGGMYQLEKIVIPGTLKEIPSSCFQGSYKVEEIIIEEGTEKIGSYMVAGFGNENAKVYLPKSIKTMENECIPYSQHNNVIIYGYNDIAREYAESNGFRYFDRNGTYDISDTVITTTFFDDLWFVISENDIHYSGKPYEPKISVNYGNIPLTEGNEYSVTYKNNINVGEATVTVTGVGLFTGSRTTSFKITESVYNTDINLEYDNVIYTGDPIEPAVTIKHDGKTLVEDKDYTLEYKDNIEEGYAKVIVTGMGFYRDSLETGFNINKYSIWNADVSLEHDSVIYTGEAIEPAVEIKHDGKKLVEGKDYTLEYRDNITEGNAKVIITGIGSYNESRELDFWINKYSIWDAEVSLDKNSFIYDGTAKEPKITLKHDGRELIEGKEYSVEYQNNTEEGTATAVITGIGGYYDSREECFYISKISINNAKVSLDTTSYIYDGTAKEPQVTVKYKNVILTNGVDYTLEYKNNIEEGTASVIITGQGTYYQSVTKYFEINKYKITDNNVVLDCSAFAYDGTAKEPAVTVTYDGNVLVNGTDYTIEYSNNVEVGTASVTVTGLGVYKCNIVKNFTISRMIIDDADVSLSETSYVYDGSAKEPVVTVIYNGTALSQDTDYTVTYSDNVNVGTAIVTVTGAGIYGGSKTITYNIGGISIEGANVTLNNTIFTYDGSPKMPEAGVVLNGTVLKKNKDFVLDYENNINVGTADTIIIGMGIYAGEIRVPFAILEAGSGMDGVYDSESTALSESFVYRVMDDDEPAVEISAMRDITAKNVVIPDTVEHNGKVYKVTSIGEKAFYQNKNIKKVSIGNNVENIENYAFYGCKNLTTVQIGNGVKIIGNSSFRKCSKLTKIVLPKCLDTIDKYSFHGCKKLKCITFKANSVPSIGDKAISGIAKNAVIKVPKKKLSAYTDALKPSTGFKKSMKIKKK